MLFFLLFPSIGTRLGSDGKNQPRDDRGDPDWVETVAWGRRELGMGFIVFKEAKGPTGG